MADASVVNYVGTRDGSVRTATWTLTTADPTGTAIEMPEWADRTWTASGTFGGATVAVQGANENTDALFADLSNAAGATALTFTALGCKACIELPLYARPKLTTVGAGATITVKVTMRRANPMRQ